MENKKGRLTMDTQKFRLNLTIYHFDGPIPIPTSLVFSGSGREGLRKALSLLSGAADGLWNPEEDAKPQPAPAANPVPAPKPAPQTAKDSAPTAAPESNVKGLALIHCPDCKKTFEIFFREPVAEVKCNCGRTIQLHRHNTAKFEFTCRACKKVVYGYTNLTGAVIEAGAMECVCGEKCPEMLWRPVRGAYHD